MPTVRRLAGNISLVFDPGEQKTADLIGAACERAIELAKETWGLGPPLDCRIYVMTSWLGFVFQSAPWPWRILLGATLPLWGFRARRTWPYSAAWTQRYGKRVAIGVKPLRLLEHSSADIGVRIFVEETDRSMNIQHVTCHELVHACSAHLRLPMWLNEGIATLTVDQFLGKQTIRQDTLDYVRSSAPKGPPPTYRELSRMDMQAIAYHGARGYWLVRYLEESRPGFLRRFLSGSEDLRTLEREMADELRLEAQSLWSEVDGLVFAFFQERSPEA